MWVISPAPNTRMVQQGGTWPLTAAKWSCSTQHLMIHTLNIITALMTGLHCNERSAMKRGIICIIALLISVSRQSRGESSGARDSSEHCLALVWKVNKIPGLHAPFHQLQLLPSSNCVVSTLTICFTSIVNIKMPRERPRIGSRRGSSRGWILC